MTVEHRVLFDLDDVRSVVFECNKCGGRLSVPTATVLNHVGLKQCRFCGEQWLATAEQDATVLFILSWLRDVQTLQKGAAFKTRLEFDAPHVNS